MGVPQTIEYLGELITILNGDVAEVTGMEKHSECVQKLHDLRVSLNNQYKEDIKGLLDGKQEMEGESVCSAASEQKCEAEFQEAAAALNQAQSHQQQIKQILQDVEEAISKKKEENQALLQDYEAVKQTTTESLPRTRHEVNLHSNISKIRWQYECGPDEIKGYVCNKNEVKPFALNSKQNSQFFIANYLWDLMEPDW